ncbi:MAG: thymidine phosphorylase [Bacillota bacterium]|nr:thymidine phosphorylase [Bacillota bacterium]
MRMYDIIYKKRFGGELSDEEINFFINGYVSGEAADYQASALLMAICISGMAVRETAALAMAMAHSGKVADLSSIKGVKVDKHSTGGVGDTATLVAVPLAAACGAKVAKMSGRGLAHTGGTIDKLESIPGFNAKRSIPEFIDIVKRVGAAVISQSAELAPADKKLYALRDVTATVDCVALIASSIMSKKIAAGCGAVVLDVKTGSGAFMRDPESAFALAKEMVDIGIMAGMTVIAIVTDMDEPLGSAVGNALEVMEAVDALKGRLYHAPLWQVSRLLAQHMLIASGFAGENVDAMIGKAMESGAAYAKFREMIRAEGGDDTVLEDERRFIHASQKISVLCPKEGYIRSVNAKQVGLAAMLLGAGREKKEDRIDHSAGIILKKRAGDHAVAGEEIALLYVNDEKNLPEAREMVCCAFDISKEKPCPRPIVYGTVDRKGIHRFE